MREPFLVRGTPSVLWVQVNNPGRRQLEWVGEAHLSPGGANRLHLLLLGRQTEHNKHMRDSVQRQWMNMLLCRYETDSLNITQPFKRPDMWSIIWAEEGKKQSQCHLTLRAATAALPSSLSSSSSSSLHSQSPSSVLCSRPLEPGTRRTWWHTRWQLRSS